MTAIPIVPPHGTQAIKDSANEKSHLPSALEVLLVPDTPTVALKIEVNGYTSVYPLSLPTAMQLAKGLRQAVCRYLNGPETE